MFLSKFESRRRVIKIFNMIDLLSSVLFRGFGSIIVNQTNFFLKIKRNYMKHLS